MVSATYEKVEEFQTYLNKAQATPFIGVIPSALKVIISLAEIITGFAIAVIAGIGAIFTGGNEQCMRTSATGGAHTIAGLIHLASALINISTLTYFGVKSSGGNFSFLTSFLQKFKTEKTPPSSPPQKSPTKAVPSNRA